MSDDIGGLTESDKKPVWHQWWPPIAAGLVFIVLNILAWQWLTSPVGQHLLMSMRDYAAPGVFLVMLIANATIVVPIPWPAIVIPIAQSSHNLSLVIVGGAFGSVIGESLAFFVGRSGRGVVNDTRFYRWVQRQIQHPWWSALVLFVLAAPPNPLFDVAGITAGAVGVPFWLFFCTVFIARIIRLWIIIAFAGALGL